MGSIDASLLKINPPVNVSVVATEGFGDLPMSTHTFSILTSLSRREVSIRGQTPNLTFSFEQDQLGQRPVIIIVSSLKSKNNETRGRANNDSMEEATVGCRVRVTQGRFLGSVGTIDSIPPELQATQAGVLAPGANVKFGNQIRFVPWVNLEQIV